MKVYYIIHSNLSYGCHVNDEDTIKTYGVWTSKDEAIKKLHDLVEHEMSWQELPKISGYVEDPNDEDHYKEWGYNDDETSWNYYSCDPYDGPYEISISIIEKELI